jgi:hypothetical protein
MIEGTELVFLFRPAPMLDSSDTNLYYSGASSVRVTDGKIESVR